MRKLILGFVFLLLCLVCLFVAFKLRSNDAVRLPVDNTEQTDESDTESDASVYIPPISDENTEADTDESDSESAESADDESDTETDESETDIYVSKIDFDELTSVSSDIRAWLSMPGMDIEAPIMAHDTDNEYYHRKNIYGEYSLSGSYYIENYNSFDFTDPVTVVYGHNMQVSMFGKLQENYSNEVFFRENNEFTLYTPDAQYDYTVIAAVPYSNRHILYYHDFFSFAVMEKFLKEIYSTRSLSAVFDRDTEVEEGDRLCILSTCLDEDSTKRYLVIGVWKHPNNQ